MTFQKGEKWQGNATGRPVGSGHRQQLFKNLVEPHKEELFDTALKLALSGHEGMLRLFLERMLPAKPVDDVIAISIPKLDINKASALSALGATILQAVSDGEMTPDQANSVMAILDAQRKNIEASDIALRLAEIERALKQRKKEK